MDYSKFKGIEVGMHGKFWTYDGIESYGELEKIDSTWDASFYIKGKEIGFRYFKPMNELELFAEKCRDILPKTVKWFAMDKDGDIVFYKSEPRSLSDNHYCWATSYDGDEDCFDNQSSIQFLFPDLPEFPKDIDWKESKIKIHD